MAPKEFTARSSRLGSVAEARHGRFGWVSHTLHRNVDLTRCHKDGTCSQSQLGVKIPHFD
jgi:hypothetical protein